MNNMSKSENHSIFLAWFVALLLSVMIAGCSGGQDSIPGGGIVGLAPMVTLTAPLATTPIVTDVQLNSKITAAFTKDMAPATINTSTFTLACPTDVPGTVAYVAPSRVAVFSPTANLPASATCTATVTTDTTDTNGISLASNYTWTFVTGTTPDATPPTVTGTINANGAINVTVNTKVGATFSEAMDPLSITNASFAVTATLTGTAVTGAVTYSGVSAVFAPASNLAANTKYTATITTGAKNVKGVALANNYTWTWTTAAAADTVPPTVTGTVHFNGQTNIAINTKLGATFSEAMNPLSITNANFTLTATASGAAVAGLVSYSGMSAVFIPSSNLAPGTSYTATLKGGAGGVTDLAGNPMASNFVINWTTAPAADTTPPTVIRTINANGATGVSINTKIGATFSEGMDPLTITTVTFGLRQGATNVPGTVTYTGMNAVFTPTSILAPATLYTASITAGATDLAGNTLTSPFSWSFTTGAAPDTTAPTATSTVPLVNVADVPINTLVTAIFSEPMDPLTVTTASFSLACPAGTPIAGTVGYGVTGNVMTFTPIPGSLPANTTCTATISTGVKDVAGNALASALSWTFTTAAGKSFCEQSFTQTDHFTAGSSINGQNGWSDAGGFDEQVQNVGAAAYSGQNVWKLSSKTTSGSYSNQPLSPQLSESAGESTVRSPGGGDAFEAVFWTRPVSPSADGSSITISMSPSSADRQTYLRIVNNLDVNGGFQTAFIDYYDVANTGNFRTFTTSTGMSRTAWTKVRLVMETPDGGTNDIVQIWLDDHLVGTYSTWEDYHTWPLGGNSVTEDVSRLLFRVNAAASSVNPSFIDADSQGFYFDSMCYRVYNRTTPSSTIQFYRTGFEP